MHLSVKSATWVLRLSVVSSLLLFGSFMNSGAKSAWANPNQPKQEMVGSNTQDKIIVVDGDTIQIGQERIRLWGIDVPELTQNCAKGSQKVPCGIAARIALMGILESGGVTCQKVDTDRLVNLSRCKAGDIDVAGAMVLMRWAFDAAGHSKGYYKDWEEESRAGKHGIWALEFDKPADWRKGTRHYQ